MAIVTVLRDEIAVFSEAAQWVVGLVDALPESSWQGPGLGDWDMRALAGHTSRAALTLEQYFVAPAESEEIESAEAYYEWVAKLPNADPGSVLQRGIAAGEALGASPVVEFGAIVERVTALLTDADDRLIVTIAGGILLSNYLPTRTFELVVHGLDIARAADLESEPPREALHRALTLAVNLAVRSGDGSGLLLALTGRADPPAGFSVLSG